MNKQEIKEILLGRGYSQTGAETASEDLLKIVPELQSCLEQWINQGTEVDYMADGFSVKGLMNTYGMKYPAALLTIDWIIKDPQKAIPAIKKGIR